MKLGLALAGGGVKAASHIGVIKALEDNGIKIDMIGGTSAGSIVAALYAMGYQPDEMFRLFKENAKEMVRITPRYTKPDGKKQLSIYMGGLLSGETIEEAVQKAAKRKNKVNMKELNIPTAIVSTDINDGEKYVFTNSNQEADYYIKDSKIGVATRASSSYPGVYAPCIYKNHKLIDGGVLDNIPTDEVRKLGADKVISVKFKFNKREKTVGVAGVLLKSLDMMFDKRAQEEVQNADVVIDIDTQDATVFSIKKIEECYQLGYIQTIVKMKEMKEKLK